ncbi:MAG: hypothetical protein KGL39_13600 [Patescibacteria group bacterium]|nr:hypothetical protein [Patescibacteria group bacterium]
MRLTDLQKMRLFGYGTPEGAEKAWDTRGRKDGGDEDDENAKTEDEKTTSLKRQARIDYDAAEAAHAKYQDARQDYHFEAKKRGMTEPLSTKAMDLYDKADSARIDAKNAHLKASASSRLAANNLEARGLNSYPYEAAASRHAFKAQEL